MGKRNLPFDKNEAPQQRGVTHLQVGEDGATTIRAGDPTPLGTPGDINLDCACGNRLLVVPCRGSKGATLQLTHKLQALILLCKCGLVFNVKRKVLELLAQEEAKHKSQEDGGDGGGTPA